MKYFCIGEHLSHSFSKELHRKLGNECYELLELSKQDFDDFILEKNYDGLNITIPYKEKVIKHLDFISDEAKNIGAVNAVLNKNGKLYGYNTDFYGLRALLLKFHFNIDGKKVLILGSGGTSKTAKAVAKNLLAKEIYVVSRSNKDDSITYKQAYKSHRDAQVIINTTPCGMYPNNEKSPIDIEKFYDLQGYADVVYNPIRTLTSLKASNLGLKTTCGLYMLVYQAVCGSELFFDIKYKENIADTIYREILHEKQNIVLVGMPSSGKTTIGKALANLMQRDFYDVDDEIIKETGMTISDIFMKFGEPYFRELERSIIKDRLKNKTSCVISTGGGSVLNEKNIYDLRQNGRVYFIDRPLEKLCFSKDRPLSQSLDDIKKLYNERYEIYKKCADVLILNDGNLQDAIIKIKKDFMGIENE